MSDRVFLDANVLVSAAWLPENGLLALWELVETELLTSAYAIAEADGVDGIECPFKNS